LKEVKLTKETDYIKHHHLSYCNLWIYISLQCCMCTVTINKTECHS